MRKAKDIMTEKPHCCLPESSVREAVEVMRNADCGLVPVLNREGQCVGVVTDRDLCLQVLGDRLDPERTRLQEVMTHNPVTCHPEDNMDDVLRKMEKRMVRRIPVVDDQNKCIGIISEADIAIKEADKNKISELVEAVSRYTPSGIE